MKKIGIVTPYKGYNFGTSLQAYAIKEFVNSLGFEAYIIGKCVFSKGRDVSIKKIFIIFLRSFFRPKVLKNTFFSYRNNLKRDISEQSKKKFIDFQSRLDIHTHTYSELKKISKKKEYLFFICGSDQIWNATNLYLDPLYYLSFAPANKRVAFAPSFGKTCIPKYNQKCISKKIKSFNKLSSREESGVYLIKQLTGRDADCLIDPTLLLSKNQWEGLINLTDAFDNNYILLYFLDIPNEHVLDSLKEMKKYGYEYICLNYSYEEFKQFNIKKIDAGPLEFLKYIYNAKLILTDSFHGTVFSINFHKNFFVFNRNYGTAQNQSTRITSILKKCSLEERLVNNKIQIIQEISDEKYNDIDNYLIEERKHARKYLLEVSQNVSK